jgi:adenylate cyclase
MGTEIERKFLVASDQWRAQVRAQCRYRQGYLASDPASSVRVRLAGDQAYLNIKSATLDVTRLEFEYSIPVDDASQLLERLCTRPLIEKIRYFVDYQGFTWEIDVFEGANEGLVVAEIELQSEHQEFPRPAWVGDEVSHDTRYYNVCLVRHPFKDWVKS